MTTVTRSTEDDLHRLMMAGDEEGFTLLYRRLQGPIYRFALHMSGNPSIAEDVTQEVFMILLQDPGRFDPKRGTLPAMLFGIGRNVLRRRFEADRALVLLSNELEEDGPFARRNGHHSGAGQSEDFARAQTVERVRRAVLTLPANYRELVVLCDLQEMTYAEAAALLGCAEGTVRSRLHRARALLLAKLRPERRPRLVPRTQGAVAETRERK